MKSNTAILLALLAGSVALTSTVSGQITQVLPASLTGTAVITFDDVAGGAAPGTNYDAIFESNGADFGERFVGQTLGFSGTSDTLSGLPSGSLTLAVGAAGQNLNIFSYSPSQVLTGLGNLGFPNFDAIGEGSFAVLFDFDQSEFGFDLVGGDGGSATVDFFRRNGSLIQSVILGGLSTQSYAFSRDGGINDIAGISIWNSDGGGIGFDNLRHDKPGVVGPGGDFGGAVPEPSTYGLFGVIALAALVALRRRKA